MNGFHPHVVTAPPEVAAAFDSICGAPDTLDALERSSREDNLAGLPFLKSRKWSGFAEDVRREFAERDHLVVRGLPVSRHGATLLLAARAVGTAFRTYRGGRIVKQFTMSPWTSELSHTTREGEFHTDLNTESTPPAITAMQCLEPDPGAPAYGLSRVARLKDLLTFIADSGDYETLRFLTQQSVTMLNDRSLTSWSGPAVEESVIRYHPETLRAAARRAGAPVEALADHIDGVARAALAVSEPFVLGRGDVLLLSNHRTLHYRGECSVVFRRYPTEFVSRSVFILHAGRELSAG